MIPELFIQHAVNILFTIIVGVLSAIIGILIRRTRKAKAEAAALHSAVIDLLRIRIIEICDDCKDKGYRHISDIDNVKDMHTQYKNLGGNGTVDAVVTDFDDIPIK